jgi:PhzF family phenazine biosynthesis protein
MNRLAVPQPQIFRVFSFVDEGCSGNPAGVCLLPGRYDEDFCKKTAIAVGAPETAFVFYDNDELALRWLTRNGTEVAACGHGTLAAAYIMWRQGHWEKSRAIEFATIGGQLKASREGEYITLDFPREDVIEIKSPEYAFDRLLGIDVVFVGKARYDYLVVAPEAADVTGLRPDFNALARVETRGIIVTARADRPAYDYVNRFFAPRVGIDEDPVTGSAQIGLGLYWSRMLKKNSLTGYQASPEGGVVRVKILDDRVQISGKVGD